MTLQNMFKRKKNYSWLSEESIAHACSGSDGKSNSEDDEGSACTNENDTTRGSNGDKGGRSKKKKSFFRSVKNFILLKKIRSSRGKRRENSTRDIYEKLDEDFGDLDDDDFEIVRPKDKNANEMENLEDVMCNVKSKKIKMDESSKERIKMKRKQKQLEKKSGKQGVRIDPKATQFKKRKSAKKKAMKATKRTGKFIGRGALYTGSAFQYIAPVASLPPERNWKRWEERSPREAYRQSEYIFF